MRSFFVLSDQGYGDSAAKMYIENRPDYEMMMEKFGKDLTPRRVKYRAMNR